jgi:hypothetical protein
MKSKPIHIAEQVRYREQKEIFETLCPRVEKLLERFGRLDYLPSQPDGHYSVHGDYSGHPQIVVFVGDLKMLRPTVIYELQRLIKECPDWQVEVTVAIRGRDWPNMGLYIRPHEIIDGLQRQYFPKEFRNITYEGARRGTAYD